MSVDALRRRGQHLIAPHGEACVDDENLAGDPARFIACETDRQTAAQPTSQAVPSSWISPLSRRFSRVAS